MDVTGDDTSSDLTGRTDRPLTVTATIVGKKWHPLLIAELLESGALGFTELKERTRGISDKVLSESLDDLEDHGLVDRTVIDEKPVRVEYSLTEWGRQLELVVTAMEEWGARYLEACDEERVRGVSNDSVADDPADSGDSRE